MSRWALLAWIVAPLFGAWWALRRLVHTYYFFDEWSVISRVMHRSPWSDAWSGFNGHLWVFEGLVYRLQLHWFGADSRVLVIAVFVVSLVALHLVVATLMAQGGLPRAVAPVAAGAVVYMGLAAQNFVFAVQLSPMLAQTAGLAMGAIALARNPRMPAVGSVAALGLGAALLDSGIGTIGLVFGSVVVIASWPRRHVWVVAPGWLAVVLWTAFGDRGQDMSASVGQALDFAARLLVHSAGALIGGQFVAGFAVLITTVGAVVCLARRGALTGQLRAVCTASLSSTMVAVAGLAATRSGIPGFNFVSYNRYLQNVGLPMAVGIFPLWWRAAEVALAGRAVRWSQVAALGACATIFVASLDAERTYSAAFLGWNRSTRAGVDAALVVLDRGCPGGAQPVAAAAPLGRLAPQLHVSLLMEMLDRGLLLVPVGVVVPADIESAICGPA